jgi:hypothetical protein
MSPLGFSVAHKVHHGPELCFLFKVELRCLRERGDRGSMALSEAGDRDSLTSGAALPCIYNKQRGGVFTSYAFTQVRHGAMLIRNPYERSRPC